MFAFIKGQQIMFFFLNLLIIITLVFKIIYSIEY